MKRKFSVLLITALFMVSTVFMACSNGTSSESPASSGSSVGKGQVMGAVLDNRGEPVEGALVTLGNKQVKTNSGGEFVIPDVSINDVKKVMKDSTGAAISSNVTDTTVAFTLTAKKEGYLSATIPAVYVTYQDIESAGSAAYIADLKDLYGKYTTLLGNYATAVQNAGGQNKDVTITGQTTDVVTTTTTSTSSNADTVFKPLADAIASLKDKINVRDFNKEFLSTFTVTNLIPLDASFAGTVKLNLTAKTDNTTVVSEKTYKPTSAPVVHITYKPVAGKDANYSWDTTVDENGNFKFDKCLPSGVSVSVTIDSFCENISGTDYVFSSESSVLIVENSNAGTTMAATPTAIALDTINGQKSVVYMLYAQNDKIWITDTSVKDSTGAKLIDTQAPITFKFSKAMSKVDIVPSGNATSTGIKDFDDKNVTLVLSADKKTATFTPNDGNWTLVKNNGVAATKGAIKITGEATDGATTILNPTFEAYFDTKIWINLDAEAMKTFNDVDGLLALNAPIVLTFSKKMTEFVEVSLKTSNDKDIKNIYTKTWSDDMKTLTIKPDTYWDVSQSDIYKITVKSAKAADGTDEVHYWKNGLATDEKSLNVYFDDYVDVVLDNISTATQEAFTITFEKELKAFDKASDIKIQVTDENGAAVTDFEAELGDLEVEVEVPVENTETAEGEDPAPTTKKEIKKYPNRVITVSAKNKYFSNKGKYFITLSNLEATDGSAKLRPAGAYLGTTKTYTTDFSFDGFVLRVIDIDVVKEIPDTAVESRAANVKAFDASTNDFLKVTFNKPIYSSKIKVGNDDASMVSPKNWIDGDVVYVPLNEIKETSKSLVVQMKNLVEATDGDKLKDEPSYGEDGWYEFEPKFFIYSAVTLEGSSLVEARNTASDIVKYLIDDTDTINVGDKITFTFSEKVDTVTWTLYVKDDSNKGKYVTEGKATLDSTGTVATIISDAIIPYAEYANTDRVTTFYIDLAAYKGDVNVFNTTNPFFPSTEPKTFEKDGISQIFQKASDNSGTYLKCGTIEFKLNPILLVETSLADEEKEEVVNIAAKAPVTFKFDKDLKGYKVVYEIADKDNKVIDAGEADLTSEVVSIKSDKMVIDNDNAVAADRTTKYTIKFGVVNADDVVIFATDKNFPSKMKDTFEKDVLTDNNTLKAIVGNGVINTFVKPVMLEDTNLVDQTAKKVADKVVDLEQKTPVTFTFDTAFADKDVAEYELFDKDGNSVEKGEAKIAGNTVTIPAEKIVIDPTKADTSNGKTKYEIALTIKDKDDFVIFSTKKNFPIKADDSFEKEVSTGDYSTIFDTSKNAFAFNVKPYTIEAVDALLEEDLKFGEGQKSYTAKAPLLPGAEIEIKFSSALPKGAVVEYEIYDTDGTTALPKDDKAHSEKTIKIEAATDTIKISSPEMAGRTDKDTDYRIYINIKTKNADDEDEVIFSTKNKYFGKASDYEADGLATNNFIDSTNGMLIAKVVQTKVLTVDKTKDDTVKTTTKDKFEESYKSPITLQLSHDVAGYKAVIYAAAKLYTDAKNPATQLTLVTDPATTYDEFIEKNAEYIYASTVPAVTANLITITPTNYFSSAAKVNIALFDADGKYTEVKFDDGSALSYTVKTAANNDNIAEMLKAPTDLAVTTEAKKIGNAQNLEFGFDTVYSDVTRQFATYTLYVKNAGDDNYTNKGDITTTAKDENELPLTETNFKFDRAKKTNFVTAIAADAFQYGGNVEVAVIQTIDGVDKAYYAKLTDGIGPELPTISTDVYGVVTNTSTETSKTLTVAGVLEPTGTNDAIKLGTDLVITVRGNEWLKTVTASYTGKTNDTAATADNKTSKATVDKILYTDSYTATITLKDVFLFKGDSITINATDTSNNTTKYTVTITD